MFAQRGRIPEKGEHQCCRKTLFAEAVNVYLFSSEREGEKKGRTEKHKMRGITPKVGCKGDGLRS